MAKLLGHRQTKEAATDKPDLLPPRHISTLPSLASHAYDVGSGKPSSKLMIPVSRRLLAVVSARAPSTAA
jgi:hypothetical protein